MKPNPTVSDKDKVDEKYDADLEDALDLTGIGWYNIKYSLVVSLFRIATVVEPVGYSYVLPAAKCDLNMTDAQRGFIASLPYIGIVLTSFPWGYLVDTQGRKKIAVWSSLVAGIFAMLSAFMPGYTSFVICKSLVALCFAAPASIPFPFIGELVPRKHRDIMMTTITSSQIFGTALVPIIAWLILPTDFRINFGAYDFRPWRLICLVNASFFLLPAILMYFGPESPKFLVAQGRYDEALKVLANIYAGNKNTTPDKFPVKSLKVLDVPPVKRNLLHSLKEQSIPVLKPPYLKWLLLNSFLLFGEFATLNGLFIWVPDILNRVLTGNTEGFTACQVLDMNLNTTNVAEDVVAVVECDDSISRSTFIINTAANSICAVIAVIGSSTVNIIGKKALLVIVYGLIGVFLSLVNVVTNDVLFIIFLSSIPIMGIISGPVNAYSVEIFPTEIRGMAISLTMMCGRIGSIAGSNLAGLLLNIYCAATFYVFGVSLLLCAALTFLLPKSKTPPKPEKASNS